MVCSWKMESALNYEVLKKGFLIFFWSLCFLYIGFCFLSDYPKYFFGLMSCKEWDMIMFFVFFHSVHMLFTMSIYAYPHQYCDFVGLFSSQTTSPLFHPLWLTWDTHVFQIFLSIFLFLSLSESAKVMNVFLCFFQVHKTGRWAMSITLKLSFKIHISRIFLKDFSLNLRSK